MCSSFPTPFSFTDGSVQYAKTSMFVPAPVISLAVKPKQSSMFANFSKALQRFCKVRAYFTLLRCVCACVCVFK